MTDAGVAPPVWLGASQTADQLERLPLPWFHNAIDRLLADTVPEKYWRKVIAKRQAEAWDVR